MIIHDVVQGSPEWEALRAKHHRSGSVAPAMMGTHKQNKRTELLHMVKTGSEQEFSDFVREHILDRGHRYEAMARPIAEQLVGEDLYPSTVSTDDGYLLASLDGMTMGEDIIWEHKQYNAGLFATVLAGTCPDYHYWQVVQGLAITGAGRCLFTVSDGTADNAAHLWIDRNEDDIATLMAGWRQFDEDLASYIPAPAAAPIVVADIEALPVLQVELAGSVIASNLVVWRDAVGERIRAINTDLQSDEDFATAEKTVKFLDDGEKRLDLVKMQALAQTASIDELFRAIDSLREDMRAKRLQLDKLVKARKDAIRTDILQSGVNALADHLRTLNMRIGKPYMPQMSGDFAGVMKGKKTISSLRDAVSTELARMKIEANAVADKITINLGALRELAADYASLFPDTAQIVLKAPDDFVALVKVRIAQHADAEAKRLEAERERIRQEEQARITQQQDHPAPIAAQPIPTVAPAATVLAPPTQGMPDDGGRMRLGEITTALGFAVTAEFLAQLGVQFVESDRNAKLYRKADFPAICDKIAAHCLRVGGWTKAA